MLSAKKKVIVEPPGVMGTLVSNPIGRNLPRDLVVDHKG